MGGSEDAAYMLNTDYNPTGMTGQDLTALVSAWQGSAISYETFYENLQRGEIANTDRTAEDEQKLISDADMGLGNESGGDSE